MNLLLKATFTSLTVKTVEMRICNFQKNQEGWVLLKLILFFGVIRESNDNPYLGGDPFKEQQLYNAADIPAF